MLAEILRSPTRVNALLVKFRFPLEVLNPKKEGGEREKAGLSEAGVEVDRDERKFWRNFERKPKALVKADQKGDKK